MTYFNGINNIKDLKEKYLELIKQYHPVLHDDTKQDYMEICMNIEKEFKQQFTLLKDKGMFNPTSGFNEYGFRLMDSIKASERKNKFVEDISNELCDLPIYRRFFDSDIDRECPNNDILCADSNIPGDGFIIFSNEHLITEVFHYCFIDLCLDIDDVEKIYELCDWNAEKFKRVILFLREGNLEPFDFRINLYSDDTIPFFDDEIVEEELPDYNSSMIIISEVSTRDSIRAWHRFCDRQSESFDKKHYAKLKEIPKVAVKK